MSNTAIPIPGTPASAKSRSDLRGAAQREAVALVNAWQNDAWRSDKLIPAEELALLRCIAAHGLATRMMAALGHDVERLTAIVLRTPGLFEENVDEDDKEEDEDADPDGPPHGQDWCRRGCQVLFGMECGMCGYEGRGVWASQVDTAAEHCCHCNARTIKAPRASASSAARTPRRPTRRHRSRPPASGTAGRSATTPSAACAATSNATPRVPQSRPEIVASPPLRTSGTDSPDARRPHARRGGSAQEPMALPPIPMAP